MRIRTINHPQAITRWGRYVQLPKRRGLSCSTLARNMPSSSCPVIQLSVPWRLGSWSLSSVCRLIVLNWHVLCAMTMCVMHNYKENRQISFLHDQNNYQVVIHEPSVAPESWISLSYVRMWLKARQRRWLFAPSKFINSPKNVYSWINWLTALNVLKNGKVLLNVIAKLPILLRQYVLKFRQIRAER